MRPSPEAPEKSSLAQTQQWLRWIITNPKGPYKALAEAPGTTTLPDPDQLVRATEPLPRRVEEILEAPPITREQRLSVYADAYFIRLLECLGADFRAVRRALEPADFQRLIADYLLRHPSSSPHVGDLGQGFPEFLASHPVSSSFGFLPDLARLEWNVLRAIYSERLPPLNVEALSGVSTDLWPAAQLTLDPTVHLLGTEWAVDKLWEHRQEPPTAGRRTLSKRRRRWLVVYRDDTWAQVRPVDGAQWFALERIREGATLERVCDDLTKLFEDAESLPVMTWFTEWIQLGIVKRIQFKGDPS